MSADTLTSAAKNRLSSIDWRKFSDVDSDLRFIAYKDLNVMLDDNDFKMDVNPVWISVLDNTFCRDCSGEVVYEAADCFVKFILRAAQQSNIDFLVKYSQILIALWTSKPSVIFSQPNSLDTADRILTVLNTSIRSKQTSSEISKYFISRFLAPIYINATEVLKTSPGRDSILTSLRTRINELLSAVPHLRKNVETKELASYISEEMMKSPPPLSEPLRDLAITSLCLAPMPLLIEHFQKTGLKGLVQAGLTRFNENVKDNPDYTFLQWQAFSTDLKKMILNESRERGGDGGESRAVCEGLGPLLCQQFKFAESFGEVLVNYYVRELISEMRIFKAKSLESDSTNPPAPFNPPEYESDMEYDDLPPEHILDYDLWHAYANEAVSTFRAASRHGSIDLFRKLKEPMSSLLTLMPPGQTYTQELTEILNSSRIEINKQQPSETSVGSSETKREALSSLGDFMKDFETMAAALRCITLCRSSAEEFCRDVNVQCLCRIIKSKEEFVTVSDFGGGIIIKKDLSMSYRTKASALLIEMLRMNRNLINKNLSAIVEASYYAIGDDVSHETYADGLVLIDTILDTARDIDPRIPLKKIVNMMEAVCSHGEFRKLQEKGDPQIRTRLETTRFAMTYLRNWLASS